MFSDISTDDIVNPCECIINDLNDLKDHDWIKCFTLSEDFSKLSFHPYILETNIEKFYLIAESKEVGKRKIVAVVDCSKEEALKVFPQYNNEENPVYFTDTFMEVLETESRENKKINYFNHVPKYLDHVMKNN